RPAQFTALVSRPVAGLSWLLTPARVVLGGLTELTLATIGHGRPAPPELREEELRTLVGVGAREGVVERDERDMIHNVFELEDTLVREVMVPRTDIFGLDVKAPVEAILPALREHLHSRVPVYEGTIDSIIGILYTKDLLRHLRALPPDFDLRAVLHPPYFVPESKRADALNTATGLNISNTTYDTVGGSVLDLFGRVPRKAERVETPELAVTVEKVERTRVVEVLVTIRKPAPGEAAA